MSYNNYKKAMDLAKQCNYYYVSGGVSREVLEKAQEKLDILFSKQLYEYLHEYGYLSFYGNEFYGIIDVDFSGAPEAEMVINAFSDRKDYGLPLKWIPIYNFYDGTMAYLDYDNLNNDGEPRVILGVNNGDNYEVLEVLAEDFGDFLFQQVEEELAYENNHETNNEEVEVNFVDKYAHIRLPILIIVLTISMLIILVQLL